MTQAKQKQLDLRLFPSKKIDLFQQMLIKQKVKIIDIYYLLFRTKEVLCKILHIISEIPWHTLNLNSLLLNKL